jgi:hypothetical protein
MNETADRTLRVGADVAALLAELGYPCAVIGAVALAVHGYARATQDLDLATLVRTPHELRGLAQRLRDRGYDVEERMPDAEDPLGGVLTVNAAGADPVQIVNYFNPWNGWAPCGKEALEHAVANTLPDLAVVDLPHLVALKIYAGGRKSALDVLELLSLHDDADTEKARAVCRAVGLGAEFDALVRPPS